MCGEAGCGAVYRVGEAGALLAREPEERAEAAAQRSAELERLQREAAELKVRRAAARKAKDSAGLSELSSALRGNASAVERIRKLDSPPQLWCPFCCWKPKW